MVKMPRAAVREAAASEGAVVTKAVLRAAGRLGINNRTLGRIIGLSEASVSRMVSGAYLLAPGDKPFELAVLLLRLYRSLDAMARGDNAVALAWLEQDHAALDRQPLAIIQSVQGLVHAVGYLDARRALV